MLLTSVDYKLWPLPISAILTSISYKDSWHRIACSLVLFIASKLYIFCVTIFTEEMRLSKAERMICPIAHHIAANATGSLWLTRKIVQHKNKTHAMTIATKIQHHKIRLKLNCYRRYDSWLRKTTQRPITRAFLPQSRIIWLVWLMIRDSGRKAVVDSAGCVFI